jgi:hypothetical protein
MAAIYFIWNVFIHTVVNIRPPTDFGGGGRVFDVFVVDVDKGNKTEKKQNKTRKNINLDRIYEYSLCLYAFLYTIHRTGYIPTYTLYVYMHSVFL